MATTKYVVFYKPDPQSFEKAQGLFAAHTENMHKFHSEGKLEFFGAFADLLTHGSMGIFVDLASAEEFVTSDPFVKEGIVKTYEICEWKTIVG